VVSRPFDLHACRQLIDLTNHNGRVEHTNPPLWMVPNPCLIGHAPPSNFGIRLLGRRLECCPDKFKESFFAKYLITLLALCEITPIAYLARLML
jgi:hypothetical protein